MKNKIHFLLFCSLLVFAPFVMRGQEKAGQEKTPQNNEDKVKDIIGFLEYILNQLGDPSTSARDKDVIVTESYSKIFRDAQVQIEDDLDENRDVITNKDITAYLKDVNFFFRNAKFSLEIQDIESSINDDDNQFYKVSLQRNLSGVTIDGDTVNQTIPRYVEINLNPEDRDMKIVSIYTNELNQNEAWKNWWEDLSYEWKSILRQKIEDSDFMTLDKIKSLAKVEQIDISGNTLIQDIRPLSRITGLKKLNVSNTQISDIAPIRNLTKLEELDVSNTSVNSIEFLKYNQAMRVLNISHTTISDISVLARMPALEIVELEGTPISDFTPLSGASRLQVLNAAKTKFAELSLLSGLPNLQILDLSGTGLLDAGQIPQMNGLQQLYLDSTFIDSVTPLQHFTNLQLLSINKTNVNDILPLVSLNALSRIYCDQTGVTQEQAIQFTDKHENALVIFQTEDLLQWWSELPAAWKTIFETHVPAAKNPSRESLASVTRLDSLNISSNDYIQDLGPLNRLLNLRKLQVANTSIKDLNPLSAMRNLTYLDISHTEVVQLDPLKNLLKLEVIKSNNTAVSDLGPIRTLPNIRMLQVDQTSVADTSAVNMARAKPSAVIIYKTEILTSWWEQLSDDWKSLLKSTLHLDDDPGSVALHELISKKELILSEPGIYNLNPLTEFIRLKKLQVIGTRVSNLGPLSALPTLQELYLSRNPVEDLAPISSLLHLRKLDISNTPVEDLDFLEGLSEMLYLDCSGTQIKRLDPLEDLKLLEYLDCSNTSVKRLDPVTGISLKTLKCYNTRISDGRIEDFKDYNENCVVSYY